MQFEHSCTYGYISNAEKKRKEMPSEFCFSQKSWSLPMLTHWPRWSRQARIPWRALNTFWSWNSWRSCKGHFNQIISKTDFSADLEVLQSEMPWVRDELILPRYCIYAHFADLQLLKEMNYKAKDVQKENPGTIALAAALKPPLNCWVLMAKDSSSGVC